MDRALKYEFHIFESRVEYTFPLRLGSRQRCSPSPLLFNIIHYTVLTYTEQDRSSGKHSVLKEKKKMKAGIRSSPNTIVRFTHHI